MYLEAGKQFFHEKEFLKPEKCFKWNIKGWKTNHVLYVNLYKDASNLCIILQNVVAVEYFFH